MPNKPKTPNHSVRSPGDIWGPAETKADRLGLTMTDVVNTRLQEWTKRPLTKAERQLEQEKRDREKASNPS